MSFEIPSISRRRFLKHSLAAAGVMSGLALGMPNRASAQSGPIGDGKAGKLVIRTPGGIYEEAWREVCWEPFSKETGYQIVPIATNAARILAMIETGASDVDVLDYGPIQFITLAEKDALLKLDKSQFKLTDLSDINTVTDYYLGALVYSTVLAYNTEVFKDKHPQNWAEFWDAETFPGPRILEDVASGVVDLEFALLADGVPMDDLYPIDIDRAFDKLRQIRPSIVKWWDSGAVAAQMLAEKQAVLGSIWNGRAQTLMEQGAPIGIQWNQSQRYVQGLAIMKNSKNIEGAYKLLDYSLQPSVQSALVQRIAYGPANRKAFETIPEELAAMMPTSQENLARSFESDPVWWSQNGKEVAERWQEFLLER
ncbi:MAG TPA: extracellular solute-binding protein [Rhizobiaceae bacterium]|nr:extracellular solute-binding protein [Rhizobiaceae bacterium]